MIEVHDRDLLTETEPSVQALFGVESQDDLIGTHAFSSALPHMIGADKPKWPSPFGTALVNLGELLSGQTTMELMVPVVRGPRNSADSAVMEPSSAGLAGTQILPGDYLESGCELTLKIELQQPLSFPNAHTPMVQRKAPQLKSRFKKDVKKSLPIPDALGSFVHTPFNRMVYIILAGRGDLVERLLAKVNKVNAKALGLEALPPDVQKAALSTYKTTE